MTYREERIGDARLILGDCRDIIPTLSGIDAVVTDPPYYGVKKDAWDNQWKTEADFLSFIGHVSALTSFILNDAGSLYHFASPQMASRVENEIRRNFRVLNNIVWNKGAGRKGVAGTGIDVSALRCFWSASSERIIFAEMRGGDAPAADASGYFDACQRAKTSVIGDYLRGEFRRAGVTNKQVAALFPSNTGGMTGCVSNWVLGHNVPTAGQYEAMRGLLNRDSGDYLRRDYDYLRRDYEDMRRDYEDMRRPFFLEPADVWGDVWDFPIEKAPEHPTQKPLLMMTHIVKTSTRRGGLVCDPFAGSGTTGVACAKLGRRFIGVEQHEPYFDIACKRIEQAYQQRDLFVAPPRPAAPVQPDMLA